MVLGAVVVAGVLVVAIALPVFLADARAFVTMVPDLLVRGWTWFEDVAQARGVALPQSLGDMTQTIGQPDISGMIGSSGGLLRSLVGGTASVVSAVAGVVMVPVLTAYLLYDFDRIVAAIHGLLPARWRSPIAGTVREIDKVLSAYVRGQVAVMLLLMALYTLAYGLLSVRGALLIGVVAGGLAFIPYVGAALGLGLALTMCALHFQGWLQVGLVVAAYASIQTLEGLVITPRIVGDRLGIAAVWIILALMMGAELFGFLGVLLALPGAAVCKVLLARALTRYRESSLFNGTQA